MNADGSRHVSDPGRRSDMVAGQRIAFMRAVDGKPQIFTRWMDAEALKAGQPFPAPHQAIEWSPDGQRIAFLGEVPMSPAMSFAARSPVRCELDRRSDGHR